MLVHTVFFWLKKSLDGDQVTHFRMGLESLTKIKHAKIVYVGSPSETPERPVIDSSYDFSITVILKNVEDHDAYQIDPRHLEFLETFKDYWKKVRVYDAD